MQLKATETQIRNSILSWLALHDGFVFIHDSVGIFDPKIGCYRMRHGVHRKLGVSDILGIWKRWFIAIEVKSATGKVSPHQKAFLDEVNRRGHIGCVARSIFDVERELRHRGVF